jgi:drug/metabolite transporter (DMT)-like permease
VFTLMAAGPAARNPAYLRARRPALQILRGLGIVASALFFILALAQLPIAEASAVSFASPLFITMLAVLLLGEVVGVRGWASVLVGFAGVLIVVRPGTGSFHPGTVLVLLSSLCWAISMIATRKIGPIERSTTTVVWTAGTGLLLLTALLPFAHGSLTLAELGLAVLLGVIASTGHWLAVLAYRHAAASVLAPLSYAQLIWSSTLGFIVFGTVPDQWTLIGALFIVASGLYTVQRERLRLATARRMAGHDARA